MSGVGKRSSGGELTGAELHLEHLCVHGCPHRAALNLCLHRFDLCFSHGDGSLRFLQLGGGDSHCVAATGQLFRTDGPGVSDPLGKVELLGRIAKGSLRGLDTRLGGAKLRLAHSKLGLQMPIIELEQELAGLHGLPDGDVDLFHNT
jgi:hypothetical protein